MSAKFSKNPHRQILRTSLHLLASCLCAWGRKTDTTEVTDAFLQLLIAKAPKIAPQTYRPAWHPACTHQGTCPMRDLTVGWASTNKARRLCRPDSCQLPALSLCIKQTTISCLERHSDLLHNSATNIGGWFIDGLFKDVLKEAVVAWCKVLTVAWKN